MRTMNDLIQKLTNAIFKQEGMGQDNHNPGNLRDCPWFPKLAQLNSAKTAIAHPEKLLREYPDGELVQYAKGFWVPRSRAEGVAGAAHVIALHIAQGDSLRKLISIWAPPSDGNDTELYIQHVAEWASIPNVELPLWNYILEAVS